MSSSNLPLLIKGQVVKGFGRGSKDLGCPTANFSREVAQSLPQNIKTGVYFGWAKVNSGPIYEMVANIGWCPFYSNKELSVETHVLHNFDNDFYGSTLKICVLGHLRPEKNFASLDDLIKAIKQDIEDAKQNLQLEKNLPFKEHPFFEEK